MWKKLSQYNIKILYVLTFQVLSRCSAKCFVLSRFSHFLGQIPGHFWTWTDKIQISRFYRFQGSAGNPVIQMSLFVGDYGIITVQWTTPWLINPSLLRVAWLEHRMIILFSSFWQKQMFGDSRPPCHSPAWGDQGIGQLPILPPVSAMPKSICYVDLANRSQEKIQYYLELPYW